MKVFYTLFLGFVLFFVACEKEDNEDARDDFPPIDYGNIQADAFQVLLTDEYSSITDTFGFGYLAENPNGIDTMRWNTLPNVNRYYKMEVQYYYQGVDVSPQIRAQGTSYYNCIRQLDFNKLKIIDIEQDANNDNLGLKTDWEVAIGNDINPSDETAKLSINYIKIDKQGFCDQGVNIFEGLMPAKIYDASLGFIPIDSVLLELSRNSMVVDSFGYSSRPNNNDTLEWKANGVSGDTYALKVKFYRAGVEVSNKVKEQANYYSLCFSNYNTSTFSLESSDLDDNGLPLGLETTWKLNSTAPPNNSGTMKLQLNYQSWQKGSDCSFGDTQFEVEIPYEVN
ncbi:MAG: hypothetical protein RIC95_13045 [Vicingaceae bacterium]